MCGPRLRQPGYDRAMNNPSQWSSGDKHRRSRCQAIGCPSYQGDAHGPPKGLTHRPKCPIRKFFRIVRISHNWRLLPFFLPGPENYTFYGKL